LIGRKKSFCAFRRTRRDPKDRKGTSIFIEGGYPPMNLDKAKEGDGEGSQNLSQFLPADPGINNSKRINSR